ncbi:Protein of unknown function [Bacillus cytotoxicus]
MRLQK